MQSVDQTLFVGGINLFSQSVNSSSAADFVGIIRNIVIDSVQWDLSCPSQEENTVLGVVYPSQPTCGTASLTCSGPHYTGCLDYDVESRCVCTGGFSPESCREEKSECIFPSLFSTISHTCSHVTFACLLHTLL